MSAYMLCGQPSRYMNAPIAKAAMQEAIRLTLSSVLWSPIPISPK